MTIHPAQSREFSQWMHSADPDQWHQAAQSWNWDNASYWLNWIVEQPSCDLGTALHLFWLSEPFHNLTELNPYRTTRQHDKVRIDATTLDLQVTILMRWVRESFTRKEIAFEGYSGFPTIDQMQTASLAPLIPFEVLKTMAEPRIGRTIECGEFDEGIPCEIVVAFNKANGIEPA